MSKAVLISIHPEWCELIANGKKTVEVRKTRPKLDTPFKCYIYCTKDNQCTFCTNNGEQYTHIGNGKVIGEFMCDRIFPYCQAKPVENTADIERQSCLTRKEVWEYAPSGNPVGWHISDLVIYDTPKLPGEFRPWNRKCSYSDLGLAIPKCGSCHDCEVTRPPQSWCYVEELPEPPKGDAEK